MHPNDTEEQHDAPIFRRGEGGKLESINGWWRCPHCGIWKRPTVTRCCDVLRGETKCPSCGHQFHPKVSE